MTLGSLFDGIGGFVEAATWADIKPVWSSDIAKFQLALTKQKHPNVDQLGDIKNVKDIKYVDIITGGFPCQDISIANTKAKGIKGSRSGLWAEMFRVVGIVRPKYVIIENSSAITFRGLERVLCDLTKIGYDAEWQCLSGTDFGIQQRRERLYLVAYPHQIGQEGKPSESLVFKQSPQQFMRVAPGWRTRRDLPTPRTIRSAYDVPNSLHRVEGLGNSIIPLIAYYIFECIKVHSYVT